MKKIIFLAVIAVFSLCSCANEESFFEVSENFPFKTELNANGNETTYFFFFETDATFQDNIWYDGSSYFVGLSSGKCIMFSVDGKNAKEVQFYKGNKLESWVEEIGLSLNQVVFKRENVQIIINLCPDRSLEGTFGNI